MPKIPFTPPVALAVTLAASAAASGQTTPADQLMEADRAFNAMAQKEGLGKAFIAYAADSAILMRQENQMPVIGKGAITEVYSKITGSRLSWEPTKAEIGASGDLGYTFGNYKVREGEEVRAHGVYVTIWKRQSDGSWKYVLDGGAPTPAEAPKP
jgi:ketosteroid isomerase-like protein